MLPIKNCCYRFFREPLRTRNGEELLELPPLQPRVQKRSCQSLSRKFFKRFIVILVKIAAATGSIDYLYELVARAVEHCPPSDDVCSQKINTTSGYIGISLVGLYFALDILKEIPCLSEERKDKVIFIVTTLLDVISDAAVYLHLVLFLHTYIDRWLNADASKKVEAHEAVFALQIAGTFAFAASAQASLRYWLRPKFDSCVGPEKGTALRVIDSFYGFWRGLAYGRGFILSLQDIIDAISQWVEPGTPSIKKSANGLAARMIFGLLLGELFAITSFGYPYKEDNKDKTRYEIFEQRCSTVFTTIFFSVLFYQTFTDENNIDQMIQGFLSVGIAAAWLGLEGYKLLCRNENNTEEEIQAINVIR